MSRLTPRTIPVAVIAGLALLAGACADEADQAEPAETTTTTEADTTTTESDDTTTTTEAAPPEVDVPDGYQLAEGEGVALAVPSSWLALDLAEGDFEALLDEAVEANPELEDVLDAEVRNLAAQGAVFFAIELGEGDFQANANIIRVTGPLPPGPMDLEDVARQGIVASGGTVQDVTVADLPSGEALRVSYEASVPDGLGGTVDFAGVQFYVLADVGYVITVSFPLDGDASVADVVAETFTET